MPGDACGMSWLGWRTAMPCPVPQDADVQREEVTSSRRMHPQGDEFTFGDPSALASVVKKKGERQGGGGGGARTKHRACLAVRGPCDGDSAVVAE